MTDSVQNLILDLVEWVASRERTYKETIDAWRTSCPKLPVWEDATQRGFVETFPVKGILMVRATKVGLTMLKQSRPERFDELKRKILKRRTGITKV